MWGCATTFRFEIRKLGIPLPDSKPANQLRSDRDKKKRSPVVRETLLADERLRLFYQYQFGQVTGSIGIEHFYAEHAGGKFTAIQFNMIRACRYGLQMQ